MGHFQEYKKNMFQEYKKNTKEIQKNKYWHLGLCQDKVLVSLYIKGSTFSPQVISPTLCRWSGLVYEPKSHLV